ncbi:MAG: prepilin-type N-terminal cleavage/methylation domain-containing protein [Gemmatimonadales bacterium]
MLTDTGRDRGASGGFTLIEICIAIVILTVAILGLGASTSRMLNPTANAELEFVALEAVEDRLAEIKLDPRYGVLDSLYNGTQTNLPGLTGASRVTAITRTSNSQADFQTIVVTVSGGRLPAPVSRKLIVGAP